MRIGVAALVVGCATSPPPSPTTTTNDNQVERERRRREELTAAQNVRLDEQATALAMICDPGQPARPRCLPSCYTPEQPDARAGKPAPEVLHLVCTRGDAAPYLLFDEIDASFLKRKRPLSPSKKGSWQAEVESAVTATLEPELAKGDTVRVTGTWSAMPHPMTREALRCVPVSHYTRARAKLDACGARGAIACEATGNSAVHGINVVHYRLSEARRLQGDNKLADCQQAALEAIAVARGMPRWRQYMTLNTDRWKPAKRYRTRFDGVIDEDTLFTTAIALGAEAEAVYAACGGPSPAKTTTEDEQSFHGCW